MVFASQAKRLTYFGMFLSVVFDAILYLVVCAFTSLDTKDVVIAIIAIQVLYFLMFVRDRMFHWITASLYLRKIQTKNIKKFLNDNKFPHINAYLADPVEYYNNLINGNDVDVKTKIAAAIAFGTLTAIKEFARFSVYTAISRVHEAAIEEYFEELKEKTSS